MDCMTAPHGSFKYPEQCGLAEQILQHLTSLMEDPVNIVLVQCRYGIHYTKIMMP